MNTHDKVELPPLPTPDFPGVVIKGMKAIPRYLFTGNQMAEYGQQYARAAIEADRKRRGEPVCTCKTHALGVVHRTDGPCFHYESKPAAPVTTPTDTKQLIYDLAQEAGAARYPSLSETKIDSLCFDPASFERFCERLLEMETT